MGDRKIPETTSEEVAGSAGRPLVAMVFDEESGNAVDSFDYTAEELRQRADEEAGRGRVTLEPSPFGRLANG